MKTNRARGRSVAAGLQAGARIRRDAYGIPHVEAANEHDAWLAMGFACAQDRLWQMEWYRLRGQGRWAEVVGASGLEDDRLFRSLALASASRNDVEAMAAETRAMFEAYALGVNAFLASGELPLEYGLTGLRPAPWEPWHSILLFKVRHAVMGKIALKIARTELLRRIGPALYAKLEGSAPPAEPVILPPAGRAERAAADPALLERCLEGLRGPAVAGDGSNSWAVHGSRTTSGAPVLCNDSHRPLDVPNVYWQCAVACPRFTVAGGAFPGFPAFPHFGFNGHTGWCITHAMADTQDLYLEIFDRGCPSRYLTEEGWREAEILPDPIAVRDGESVDFEIVRTRYGTLIEGDRKSGQAVALRTTATDRPCRQWECLRPMLIAGTVAELFSSQREWVDPVNNLTAADREGSIGYLTRGRLPVRRSRSRTANARQLLVPGWTGEHEWSADVPFEEMPRVVNPGEGFVVTANQRITAGDRPYIAHEFAAPGRAERIRELLQAAPPATPERIASFQADTVSVRGRGWARLLAASPALEGDAERARGLLAAWDGDLRPESGAALLYACFRQELARAAFAPLLGSENWRWIASGSNPGGESLLERWLYDFGAAAEASRQAPGGRALGDVLREALAAAWRRTADAAGSPDPRAWRWSEVHRCGPEHPLAVAFAGSAEALNPPAFGLGGDNDTIKVASFSSAPAGGLRVKDVSVYRQVIDFSAPRMFWCIPGGASGVPGSPHRHDQLDAWRGNRLLPVALSVEEAARAAKVTLTLEGP